MVGGIDDIGGSLNKHTESDYDQWKPGDPITEEIIEEVMNKPVNDLSLRDYQILHEWQKSWMDWEEEIPEHVRIDEDMAEYLNDALDKFEEDDSGYNIDFNAEGRGIIDIGKASD